MSSLGLHKCCEERGAAQERRGEDGGEMEGKERGEKSLRF